MPLRVGFPHELPPINPGMGFLNSTLLILRQVFDAPFFPTRDGQLAPEAVLLSGLTQVSPDAQVFEATFRDNIRFSDGAPATAADLVRCCDSNFTNAFRATANGNRLTFRFNEPTPRADFVLSSTPLLVKTTSVGVIGTGKYRMKTWSPKEVVLEPNRYHKESPTEEVVLLGFFDNKAPDALISALHAGEIDFAPALSWTDLAKLNRVSKITKPVNSTGSLYLNTETLSDVGLRQEIASAIDPGIVARAAFQNDGTLEARGVLPTDFGVSPPLRFF